MADDDDNVGLTTVPSTDDSSPPPPPPSLKGGTMPSFPLPPTPARTRPKKPPPPPTDLPAPRDTGDDGNTDRQSNGDDIEAWLRSNRDDFPFASRQGPPPPVNRSLVPTTNDIPQPPPPTGLPFWKLQPPQRLQNTTFGPATRLVSWDESRGTNVRQVVPGKGPVGPASGYFQIEDETWRDYAPRVGVNINRWNVAKDAPPQVQLAVARSLPLKFWARKTVASVLRAYPWANGNMTLAQIDQMAGRSPRQQYVMTTEDRDPSQWGRPPTVSPNAVAGGYLPTANDVPMIMQRGARMHRYLSGNVSLPHMLMLAAFGGYRRGMRGGQYVLVQQQSANFKQNLADTKARMEEEGMDMSSAYAAYEDNPQELQAAMNQIANKYNDGILRDIAGNPDAVKRLMSARDKYFGDISKTLTAQEKAEEDQKKQDLADRKEAFAEKMAQTRAATEALKAGDYHANVQSQIGTRERGLELRQEDIERKGKTKAPSNPYTSDGGNAPGSGGPGPAPPDSSGKPPAEEPPEEEATPPPPSEEEATAQPEQTSEAAPETQGGPAAKPAPQVAQAAPAQAKPGTRPQARETQLAQADAPATDADREITLTEGPPLAPGTEKPDTEKPKADTPTMGPAMTYLKPSGRQLALDLLMDPEALKNVPMAQRDPILAGNAELQDQLYTILKRARTGDLKGGAVTDAVRSIYEPLGDTLQSVIDAKRVVPGSGFGGGGGSMSAFWSGMSDLASMVKPGWNPNNVMASREFMAPNGRTQFTLRRAGTMARTAVNILKDLNAIKDDPKSFIQRMTEAITSKGLQGRPEYTNLYNDWQAFVQEDQAVRSGAASVTETEEQIKTVFSALTPGSKSQIRGAVIHNIQTAAEAIRLTRDLWDQYGVASNGKPDPMYGDHPDVDAAIEAFDRMDQNTGLIKGPIPKMLRDAIPADDAGFSTQKVQ